MMGEFFEGLDLTGRTLAAANGGTLSLGAHELNFVFAPMVHWPEVMFKLREQREGTVLGRRLRQVRRAGR